MFDELVAATRGVRGGASVGAWARVEAAACARRLAAMVTMLDARYAEDRSSDREQWCLDNWGAVSAEIGAAQQITLGAASHQLLIATALRDRLPRVAEKFAAGLVGYRVVAAIVFRTMNIKDPDALRAVDEALADALERWEPLSAEKLTAAIDYWVYRFDPLAVRRTQNAARSRSVDVHTDDADGVATISGVVFTPDAEAFDRRLAAIAATPCPGDPRTVDQRRADALGAIGLWRDRLACRCGRDDCAAAGLDGATPGAGEVVLHVVVNDDTLTSDTPAAMAQDEALDGTPPPLFDRPLRELTLAEALHDRDPGEPPATRPAAASGGRVLTGAITRRLALTARIGRIVHPGQAPPEPRCVPSSKLAQFVRCRDLTCRFPGCDAPAEQCDVDHTIAYPMGPTQASNLKLLCKRHHLLKTFWGGDGGWRDEQRPDGTVVWIAPDGLRHVTRPGSRLLFPALCVPTAPVRVVAAQDRSRPNGLGMPRRRRTRAQERSRRVDEERLLNALDAEKRDEPTDPEPKDPEPPPF